MLTRQRNASTSVAPGYSGTRRSRRLLQALWATALASVAGAVVATASPVWAAPAYDIIVPTTKDGATYYDPLCTASSICRTDNSTVYYYIDSQGAFKVNADGLGPIVDAMNAWGDNTDVNVVYDADPTFSGAGETDAVWRQFVYSDDTLGVTTCMDRVDGTRNQCDSHYLEISPYGGWNQKVTRHEMGHALGLVHGAQAAPVQGQCAARMDIMRASHSCMDNGTLGPVPKNNVDWVY